MRALFRSFDPPSNALCNSAVSAAPKHLEIVLVSGEALMSSRSRRESKQARYFASGKTEILDR